MDEFFHFLQLIVIDQRVDSRINACSILMGIITCAPHIIKAVGRFGPGTMMGRPHINGIGAMVDGGDGDVGITCGCQQFYVQGAFGHLDVERKRVGVAPGGKLFAELYQLCR